MLAALTAFLHAAAAYYRLKALLIPDAIHDEIDDLEDEINRLRNAGDPESQLRADRLRHRLARRRGLASALPAAGAPPASGAAGANDGRDAHTAGPGDVAQ